MFTVYILKSIKYGNLYIGRTNNFERRFAEHNKGAVFSTKSRKPFIILKLIEVATESESVALEKEYKKGYMREKIRKEFSL